MARIRLEKLRKTFGLVVAVNDISLDIEDGEFIALLGPSGCGKTTMLLMLAGIYLPTKGEIYFDDLKVNEVPPKIRGVGLVFQSYALYPHMTVYDNIAFPLRLRKTPKAEMDQRVKESAQVAQIGELLHRKPAQLSGGQQQRVALCRALVKEPDLLLLDEPLSNLDARLRIETRAELKRLQKELAITTILVTHDQIEAMTMAERVAVMRHGVIEQLSTPRELYHRPQNLFVASFIGDPPMNLVRTRYRVDNGRGRLEAAGFALNLSEEYRSTLDKAASQEVILGLRPDDIRIEHASREDGFPGTVFMTEPLGRDTLIDFRFEGEAVRALVPGSAGIEIGDQVWLVPDPQALHLFDADTEQRIPEPDDASGASRRVVEGA